jgi:RNA binding exosome subunit
MNKQYDNLFKAYENLREIDLSVKTDQQSAKGIFGNIIHFISHYLKKFSPGTNQMKNIGAQQGEAVKSFFIFLRKQI